jgi:hypothetical protein
MLEQIVIALSIMTRKRLSLRIGDHSLHKRNLPVLFEQMLQKHQV